MWKNPGLKPIFRTPLFRGLKPAATPLRVALACAVAAVSSVCSAHAQIADSRPGAPGSVTGASGSVPGAHDPLLTAMQEELAREKELLILPGMQRPYFMEYRLEDIQRYEAVANFGALTSETNGHQRIVRVEVRIGDYSSDSSSVRGDGSLQLAPQDEDPAALKFALWTAPDEAYKNALRAYANKQAALKRFQNAPNANDFAPTKPVTLVEPLHTFSLDTKEWKRRIAEASGLFATDPAVKGFANDV